VFAAALAAIPAVTRATTATPTTTPTPRVVEIPGRIFDASLGANAGIAGATVELAQRGVTSSLVTDDQGEFAFTLTIPDSEDVIVQASAAGFVAVLRSIRAGDLRHGDRVDIGLQQVTTPLTTFIYGRVYDAAQGTDAVLPHATIQFRQYGPDMPSPISGAFSADDDGLYGFQLELSGGDYVAFTIDSPGYATLNTTISGFQIAAQERINFALAAVGGVLEISPPSATINCAGDLSVSIANIAPPGETLVVLGVELSHGYSQGDYGTGFSWDLSGIEFPVLLESDEHLVVPVSYAWYNQQFRSRLHVNVISGAREGAASAVYFGTMDNCPSTPTPEATMTPSASPTPTPPGEGHRVSGVVQRDPYCDQQVRVVLEGLSGEMPRTVVVPPSNEFSFDGVADGDYTLRGESDCQLSFSAPQTVHVRGADVSAQVYFEAGCPPVITIEPDHGPPGTIVTVTGRCYRIHSGGLATFYVDGESVVAEHADTSGNYRGDFHIPSTASPGMHTIEVRGNGGVLGSATFWVDSDSGVLCTGDCNGDGRVKVAELVAGVRLAFGVGDEACSTLAKDQYGLVPVAELVAAVGNALNGCPAGPVSAVRGGD
jgi:hypothetical protein